MGLCRRPAEDQQLPEHEADPGRNRDITKGVQGARAPGFQVLWTDHRLCLHAGRRYGERSSGDLSSSCRLRQARRDAMTGPRRSTKSAAQRAWQRMLSGRRLDLLDPSPLDIEIADIAHGLARMARW